MSFVDQEIASQPESWVRAAELAPQVATSLPRRGESVAVIGCGTSWFMAQSVAALRESAGHGVTDAFTASEFPASRPYDRVVAITRSGTTTEVLQVLQALQERHDGTRTGVLTTSTEHPAAELATDTVLLDFADERSVVQTRFATTVLALFRAHLGEDLNQAVRDAGTALSLPVDPRLVAAEQITFVGQGWTVGLAHEAALKLREAANAWSESYPAMDYRHGPISIAQPGRVLWSFGGLPTGLGELVEGFGAVVETSTLDPQAHLVLAQRVAVAKAQASGLNPDQPRHLTRAVILDSP